MLNWKSELSPSPPNPFKTFLKIIVLAYIYWPKSVTQWIVVQKIYSKMHPVSCTNTRRDITDLVNHGMVKTTKTWISWKRNYWNFFYVPFEYNVTWSLEIIKLFLVTTEDNLESDSLKPLCLLCFQSKHGHKQNLYGMKIQPFLE